MKLISSSQTVFLDGCSEKSKVTEELNPSSTKPKKADNKPQKVNSIETKKDGIEKPSFIRIDFQFISMLQSIQLVRIRKELLLTRVV